MQRAADGPGRSHRESELSQQLPAEPQLHVAAHRPRRQQVRPSRSRYRRAALMSRVLVDFFMGGQQTNCEPNQMVHTTTDRIS